MRQHWVVDRLGDRAIQDSMPHDISIEKVERARAGGQAAIWNEAQTWLGPLREYARISAAIRPSLRSSLAPDLSPRNTVDRRLMFLGWEVETLIQKLRPQFNSALELLNSIFFSKLSFSISNELDRYGFDESGALLESILAKRRGPPILTSILYAWIAESVERAYGDRSDFSRVELVQGTPTQVVRLIPRNDNGEVWLVDLSKSGARVVESEWHPWCASNKSEGFTRLTWAQGLVKGLTELFKLLEKIPDLSLDLLSAQLFVLDQIITLQPSETGRWAERAMLNTRRGDRSSALDDLKRFFAFHERESAPPAIVSLFDDLRSLN